MIAEESKSPSEKRVVIKEQQEQRTRGPVKDDFRRGCRPRTSKNPKVKFDRMTRSRLMITFEDHAGFLFLLQDQEELKRLKPTSYLDSDYLTKEGKYRVHVYYLPHCKTRIEQWKKKYPGVIKMVELDRAQIRVKLDENNTFSKAILSLEKGPQLDHNPPEIPEEGPIMKKIKTGANKTKNELLSENQNLTVQLRVAVQQLHESIHQVANLRGEVKTLLKTQDNLKNLFSSLFGQVVGKLSPNLQETYRIDFDNCLNTVKHAKTRQGLQDLFAKEFYNNPDEGNDHIRSRQEHNTNPEERQKDAENLGDNGDDVFLESPKSRIFSQDDAEQNEEEKSILNTKDHAIEALGESDDIDYMTNKAVLGMEREFPEGDIREEQVITDKPSNHESVQDNESSFIVSEDDQAVPIVRSPSQTLKFEKVDERKFARIKSSSKKKPAKKIWSHLSQDVQNIMEKIKQAKPPNTSLESFLQNLKHISQNWKPVLRDHFVELKAYLDQ